MSRSVERASFTYEQRVTLLEGDADQMMAEFAKLEDRLAHIQSVLIGMLIMLSTGAVIGTLNLLATK